MCTMAERCPPAAQVTVSVVLTLLALAWGGWTVLLLQEGIIDYWGAEWEVDDG